MEFETVVSTPVVMASSDVSLPPHDNSTRDSTLIGRIAHLEKELRDAKLTASLHDAESFALSEEAINLDKIIGMLDDRISFGKYESYLNYVLTALNDYIRPSYSLYEYHGFGCYPKTGTLPASRLPAFVSDDLFNVMRSDTLNVPFINLRSSTITVDLEPLRTPYGHIFNVKTYGVFTTAEFSIIRGVDVPVTEATMILDRQVKIIDTDGNMYHFKKFEDRFITVPMNSKKFKTFNIVIDDLPNDVPFKLEVTHNVTFFNPFCKAGVKMQEITSDLSTLTRKHHVDEDVDPRLSTFFKHHLGECPDPGDTSAHARMPVAHFGINKLNQQGVDVMDFVHVILEKPAVVQLVIDMSYTECRDGKITWITRYSQPLITLPLVGVTPRSETPYAYACKVNVPLYLQPFHDIGLRISNGDHDDEPTPCKGVIIFRGYRVNRFPDEEKRRVFMLTQPTVLQMTPLEIREVSYQRSLNRVDRENEPRDSPDFKYSHAFSWSLTAGA